MHYMGESSNFPSPELMNFKLILKLAVCLLNINLSHDVAAGSEIKPCNKIDKPLVVYRFSGNVMTSITLRTQWQNYNVFTAEMRFQSNLNVI